jgi:hydroxylamine dehydrogenase
MWEHDLIKLYKGLFHMNPGGFTYTEGWSALMRDYAEIMDENTRLREKAKQSPAVSQKIAQAQQTPKVGETPAWDIVLRFILGASMVFIGLALYRENRKEK